MTAMVTALTDYADNGESRTFTTSGHSVIEPKLVIQKRRVPSNGQQVASINCAVVQATHDVDGAVLAQKVVGEVSFRYPIDIGGTETTIDDVLVILKDIVNGDEFAASIESFGWLA